MREDGFFIKQTCALFDEGSTLLILPCGDRVREEQSALHAYISASKSETGEWVIRKMGLMESGVIGSVVIEETEWKKSSLNFKIADCGWQ